MNKIEKLKTKALNAIIYSYIGTNESTDLIEFLEEEGFSYADMSYALDMDAYLNDYLDQFDEDDEMDKDKFWQDIFDQADKYKEENIIYYRDYVKSLVKRLKNLKRETKFKYFPAMDMAWLLTLKSLIIELENNVDKGTLELAKHTTEKFKRL